MVIKLTTGVLKTINSIDNKGNKYPCKEYSNIQKEYKGYKPLPLDCYPYTFEFTEPQTKAFYIKPILGVKDFETCGSKDNPQMNGIIINGTFEDAKIKLKELRKIDNTIGIKIMF